MTKEKEKRFRTIQCKTSCKQTCACETKSVKNLLFSMRRVQKGLSSIYTVAHIHKSRTYVSNIWYGVLTHAYNNHHLTPLQYCYLMFYIYTIFYSKAVLALRHRMWQRALPPPPRLSRECLNLVQLDINLIYVRDLLRIIYFVYYSHSRC